MIDFISFKFSFVFLDVFFFLERIRKEYVNATLQLFGLIPDLFFGFNLEHVCNSARILGMYKELKISGNFLVITG